MVSVCPLLDGCLRQEPLAWPTFWELVVEVAAPRVVRLLRQNHLDTGRADEVLQEFYLHLTADGQGRLATFRGQTLAELRRFLWVAVGHFTVDLIRKWRTEARREARALRDAAAAARDGPTEQEVAAACQDFEASLTDEERAKFRYLCLAGGLGTEGSEFAFLDLAPSSERTRRRWLQDLSRRFAEHCC